MPATPTIGRAERSSADRARSTPWCGSRGERDDYDAWAAAGNPGWSFDELLPAFKAIEDNEAGADDWRGAGGPVHIKDCRAAVHPLTQRYLKAAEQAGLPLNPDFNGESQEGVGVYQINAEGRPPHVGRARLPAAGDEAQKRTRRDERAGDEDPVRGHAAPSASNTSSAAARTPSAPAARSSSRGGSINSPQLLQLSGVGPAPLLQGLGIPVVQANGNVGANLQDHVGINYTFKGRLPTLNQILRPWWGKALVGMQYILLRVAARCRCR